VSPRMAGVRPGQAPTRASQDPHFRPPWPFWCKAPPAYEVPDLERDGGTALDRSDLRRIGTFGRDLKEKFGISFGVILDSDYPLARSPGTAQRSDAATRCGGYSRRLCCIECEPGSESCGPCLSGG
jgi:hypothetical protein